MKNIGILGGTLNPIHLGHLIIAQTAKDELKLDKIYFMPSGCPPHKDVDLIADKEHRSNMVKLAVEDNSYFEFSDFELKRSGTIYTADTLRMLNEQYPEDNFYFIMGTDSFFDIEDWKSPEEIFKLCTIAVAGRNNVTDNIENTIEYYKNKYKGNIVFINSPLINISSSYIRNSVKNNISIKYLVSNNVEQYIIENNLYKD